MLIEVKDKVIAARRRLKLAMLIMSLQTVEFLWTYGIDGGGKYKVDGKVFDFPAIDVEPKEKLIIKSHLKSVHKTRVDCLNLLYQDNVFHRLPHRFLKDMNLRDGVIEGAGVFLLPNAKLDVTHRITTYCYYAMYHDWMILTNEEREEFDKFDVALGRFANYLVPHRNTMLIDVINGIYWKFRNFVLDIVDDSEWYEQEYPTEEELERQSEGTWNLQKALSMKSSEWLKSIAD